MHCKQFVSLSVASLMLAAALTGCGGASSTASSAASSEAASAVSTAAASESTEAALPDGVYTAEFDTDSGMFHANEACNGMGTLTVENGQMTFHVSLASKKIVNLYVGMAADAEANKADWLLPTTDTVTYSDGTSEEVYGYDIPVAAVDEDVYKRQAPSTTWCGWMGQPHPTDTPALSAARCCGRNIRARPGQQ